MQKYTQFSYFQNFSDYFVFPKILWMPLELSAGFPTNFSAVLSEKMTIKRAFKNDKIEKNTASGIHLQRENSRWNITFVANNIAFTAPSPSNWAKKASLYHVIYMTLKRKSMLIGDQKQCYWPQRAWQLTGKSCTVHGKSWVSIRCKNAAYLPYLRPRTRLVANKRILKGLLSRKMSPAHLPYGHDWALSTAAHREN